MTTARRKSSGLASLILLSACSAVPLDPQASSSKRTAADDNLGLVENPAWTSWSFAPNLSSSCWSYTWDGPSYWIGGSGNCDFAHSSTPARYRIIPGMETLIHSAPFPSSGYLPDASPYAGVRPGFFSYERYQNGTDGMGSIPGASLRKYPNLLNFDFVDRAAEGHPGFFRFQMSLDKVNAVGLPNDEKGTSMGVFLVDDFNVNQHFNPTLTQPDLSRNAAGKGLELTVGLQLHDAKFVTSNALAHYCGQGQWVGGPYTGHCASSPRPQARIGKANGRVALAVNIQAGGHTYYLEVVPWVSDASHHFFLPYNQKKNPNRYLSPELVLEKDEGGLEQIYLDAKKMTAGKRLAANKPACPALLYGVPNAAPATLNGASTGTGDPWYVYGIDLTGLVECIPWTTPIDINHATVSAAMMGPVINGVGRVYWAAQNWMTLKRK